MNNPYVKHTVAGEVINPITQENPVIHKLPNRRMRRLKPTRRFSNKKGIQVVVTQIGTFSFLKYHKTLQRTRAGVVERYIPNGEGREAVERYRVPAKTLAHNVLVN